MNCQGTWRLLDRIHGEDPDGPYAEVLRCTGCGDQMVYLVGPYGTYSRWHSTVHPATGHYPSSMSPSECVRAAMTDRALAIS